ncbi:MAG: peroxiredoxin Q/BCP [Rubritalea sp.]|jgi:peroxiredoxin Q/BCP|tara:strand:+ start:813 stop:962 length:150 start_codon:yes stop_codon:yes gene_type:complete
MKPTIGEPAPAFSAAVIGGDYSEETQIQLSDFTGKKVVLYFYPKDSTPG